MAPKKNNKSGPAAPLIKGYLPVRLILPDTLWRSSDETFLFVREHHAKQHSEEGNPNNEGCTLFVANVPVLPNISEKVILQSIFGRYIDEPLRRVTVVPNPRKDRETVVSFSWTDKLSDPDFTPTHPSTGKFAHVVFSKRKDLTTTMRELQRVMSSGSGLPMDPLELQTLADETSRMERNAARGGEESDSDEEEEENLNKQNTGLLAVVDRYRTQRAKLTREALLNECNAVMASYEAAEANSKRALESFQRKEVDDDGFVTVRYNGASAIESEDGLGNKVTLQQQQQQQQQTRRKSNKRSRNHNRKKNMGGNEEQTNFYRFQRKEQRKRSLVDLRNQFEEDLRKVKKMKEDQQYRPF